MCKTMYHILSNLQSWVTFHLPYKAHSKMHFNFRLQFDKVWKGSGGVNTFERGSALTLGGMRGLETPTSHHHIIIPSDCTPTYRHRSRPHPCTQRRPRLSGCVHLETAASAVRAALLTSSVPFHRQPETRSKIKVLIAAFSRCFITVKLPDLKKKKKKKEEKHSCKHHTKPT